MYDIAKLAKRKGLKPLLNTNGAMNPQPLRDLLPYIEAVNVDLKAFTSEFYRLTSLSEIEPVLKTLKIVKEEGKWLEIVNLIIPTLNDDKAKIREMCLWIKTNLGDDIPLHFNRFFPAYKLTRLPPTPIQILEEAREIALEVGLRYVYIGNVPGHFANSTYCPQCHKRLIARSGLIVTENHLHGGSCRFLQLSYPRVMGLTLLTVRRKIKVTQFSIAITRQVFNTPKMGIRKTPPRSAPKTDPQRSVAA
jgi:pyruvate formate lyase activating enzyme